MGIGVSQSIFTQKNTTGYTVPVCSFTTTWDVFKSFSDIYRCGDNFQPPWVSGFPLSYFTHVPAATSYISVINLSVNNIPWHDLHREFSFGIPQYISYQSGIHKDKNCWLPWHATYIQFTHILRSGQSIKWKFEYLNVCMYLDKTQNFVEINIIIIKMIQKLVILSSSKVGSYGSHKINSGLGQKKFKCT